MHSRGNTLAVHGSRRLPVFVTRILCCLIALLGACDDDPTDTNRAATLPAPAEWSSPPVTATHPVIDDKSLTDDRYIALGLPSYDREWMGPDMAAAAAKLQLLARSKPEELPRFGSPKSGRTFARLVHPENLKFFRATSIPMKGRFPQTIQYAESSNVILKIYLSAFLENKSPGADLIELLGHQLRISRVTLELVDEFVPTLSNQDPQYQVRMAGLDQMRAGFAGVANGAITSMTEDQSYDLDTRLKLLKYARETFPHIVPRLSIPSQTEIVRRVKELVDDPVMRELRSELILLRDDLTAARRSAKP